MLAFLQGDARQMAKVAATAMGKPGVEDSMLSSQADTEGWYGRFRSARRLTQQAIDSALRNDAKELAARYAVEAAVREIAAGNRQQARTDLAAALKISQTAPLKGIAALPLAQAGDTATAEKYADELNKTHPLGTVVQRYWLPTLHAAIALERNDPSRALALLKQTEPMDLAKGVADLYLCPVYLRGQAYLKLGDGKSAAKEFQKFIDHYGIVGNFPWGALGRLGLARAYALDASTDRAARDRARIVYQDFLTLWKDADPDIPIFEQVKAEFTKL
jgi:tetratricopeptide (TPR) repeat protein